MTLWTTYMPAGAGTMMLIAAVVLPARLMARGLAGRRRGVSASCWLALLLGARAAARTRPAAGQRRPVLGEMAEVATSGGPLAIALCFGAYSCCWFAVVGFLPTLQVERLGFATSTAAIVTALVTIVNVGGNLAAGWLLQHGVPRVVDHRRRDGLDGVLRRRDLPRRRARPARLVLAGVYSRRDRRRAGRPVHRASQSTPRGRSSSAPRPAC